MGNPEQSSGDDLIILVVAVAMFLWFFSPYMYHTGSLMVN